MELYKDEDLKSARKNMLIRFGISALILVATVAGLIVFVRPLRNEIAAMAVCAIGTCALYFYLSLKALPWYRYYKYVADIRRGREHALDCEFVSFSSDERISDGVAFHEVVVKLDEKDLLTTKPLPGQTEVDDKRLFFWDADKNAPQLHPGDRIHVRSFGNYIIALDVL